LCTCCCFPCLDLLRWLVLKFTQINKDQYFSMSQANHVARNLLRYRWVSLHLASHCILMPWHISKIMKLPKPIGHGSAHLLSMAYFSRSCSGGLCLPSNCITLHLLKPVSELMLQPSRSFLLIHNPGTNSKWCILGRHRREQALPLLDELSLNQKIKTLGH
jgi:hypothetical protein